MKRVDGGTEWRLASLRSASVSVKVGLVRVTVGFSLATTQMQRIGFNRSLQFYHKT